MVDGPIAAAATGHHLPGHNHDPVRDRDRSAAADRRFLPPPGAGRTRQVFLALLALGVLARLAAALFMGDRVEPLPGIWDQLSYDALARRVLGGHGFTFAEDSWPFTRAGQPTAHWSFLYTGYLAAVYGLFGPHPLAARLIQALAAGLLGPWLTWRLGRRLFGARAGRAAALMAALYPYFIYYSAALMTELLTVCAILFVLERALALGGVGEEGADDAAGDRDGEGDGVWDSDGVSDRGGEGDGVGDGDGDGNSRPRSEAAGTWRPWAVWGLGIGVAALARQVALLPVPLLALWLLARLPWRRALPGLALAAVCALALVLPFTWRNHRAFHRLVPLNTNAGFAFYWANHPVHGTDFQSLLPADGPSYQDLVPPDLRLLDEAALDAALMARGWGFVAADPVRYLLLSLSRIDDYFMFWPSPESGRLSNLARVSSFGLALPFILYGLWLSRRHWRRCLPVYTYAGAYVLLHLLSWALVRYRLPVDGVLLVFGGLGVAALAGRLRGAGAA